MTSMMRIQAAIVGASFLAGGLAVAQTSRFQVTVTPQSAPEGYGKISIDKAAIGAAEIRLWQNTSVEPDCSPHGQTTLTIVHPPQNGTVRISDEPFFYVFPPQSARAACSQQKVPGHRAFYTASTGFSGHDKVVLEAAQPDGYVRRIWINIDVL